MTDPQTEKPYTDADVESVINAYHWAARNSCGPDNCPGAAVCVYAEHLSPEPFRAALDALAAAGRLAHDCERRCPFEDLWNDTDPKPDESLARLQAAFNDAVAELAERYAERDDALAEAKGARSDYEQLRGINAELADERDRLRRELDQIRRAAITARQP